MHLLRQGQKPREPWDEQPGIGGEPPYAGTNAGMRTWDTGTGEPDVDSGAKRRATGSGLLALGTSLLEAAPRNDWAGGLARGAAGFAESFGAERDRTHREQMEAREMKRQQTADGRAEEQERDRNRAADLSHEQGTAELAAWRDQQERGKQTRARTGKSAEDMAAEIQSLATQNPDDPKLQAMARRAAGYALGDDSDLNKLAGLHEQMTEQAFRDEDFDWKAKAEIGADKQEIAAGVKVNPVEESRRDNARQDAQLGISRGHLEISRQNADREKKRDGLTTYQAYTQVQKAVESKVKQAADQKWQTKRQKPSQAELAEWRRAFTEEALQDMQTTLGKVYDFNSAGDPIQ